MSSEQKKLSFKDLKTLSKQVLQDLRSLQKEGRTLPDILYNYRLQDGRLVLKKKRAGSISGEEAAKQETTQIKPQNDDVKEESKFKSGVEADADADIATAPVLATTAPVVPVATKPVPYEGT